MLMNAFERFCTRGLKSSPALSSPTFILSYTNVLAYFVCLRLGTFYLTVHFHVLLSGSCFFCAQKRGLSAW